MARSRTRTRRSPAAAPSARQQVLADGYVRVSTTEQAEEGVSLAAQEDRIRAYCAARGLALRTIHRDEGVSAGDALASRPAGGKLARAVATGEVGHVVGMKLDRLFRNAIDCMQSTDAWQRAGVGFHVVDLGGQAVDTSTATGKFFLSVMAACAEMELNQIRERTRVALRHKMQQGELVGAPALGWRQETQGGVAVADLNELRAVARILELCAADWTFARVAAQLEEEGIPTKRGGRWRASTVHQVWERRARYAPAFAGYGLDLIGL